MPPSPPHDRIVAALVADAHPVHRVRPARRLAIWGAVLAAVLLAFLPRTRPDLAQAWSRPLFVVDVLVLAGAGVGAAWLALRSAMPDRPARGGLDAGVMLMGGVGLLLFGLGAAPAAGPTLAGFAAKGIVCALLTIVMAALPWVVLLVAVRGGAPLRPVRAGLLAGAAAFFAAAAGMRVGCAADDPAHLLVWHAGPVALGVAASALLGAAWLRRWWLVAPQTSGRASTK